MKPLYRIPALPLLGAALLATLLPTHAMAWGAQGHRLVARVAETRLDPQAKAEVDRLLATEPGATLSSIAPWADELRRDDPSLGRKSASWHYVNMAEDGCLYSPPKHCPGDNCVVEALKDQARILADHDKTDAERLQALKFVVHFAGDIHQPMHAGKADDRGGNDYQLQLNGRGTNLHSLWDSGMFYPLRLGDDPFLARLQALPAHDASDPALHSNIAVWAEQSCHIATQEGVYPDGHKLDDRYAEHWRPVAEAQLVLAGERLAVLLNELLDSP